MNKEFVPYAQALRMKIIGFDEPCLARFPDEEGFIIDNGELSQNQSAQGFDFSCLCPTFSQAFRWFREKYDLFPIVQPYFPSNKLTWNIIFMDNFSINVGDVDGEYVESEIIGSYEKAELACLEKLIEIVEGIV